MMRFWAASSIDPSAPKPIEPKLSALEAYIHCIDRCEAIGDRPIHDARAQELGDADIRLDIVNLEHRCRCVAHRATENLGRYLIGIDVGIARDDRLNEVEGKLQIVTRHARKNQG